MASRRDNHDAVACLAERIGPEAFGRFFDRRTALRYDGDTLCIDVPNSFMATFLGRRFGTELREVACEGVGHENAQVDIRIDAARFPRTGDQPATAGGTPPGAPTQPKARPAPIRERYRLEDLVVGDANRLAYNAAVTIAEKPRPTSGGPLFIHGSCGLGKTHLLQGIAARFRRGFPEARIKCVTGESFTNQFLGAMRDKRLDRFRAAYRRLDLLCIDDVHFLASKDATQRELMHTFDEIDLVGARVVLASDEHPGAIREFRQALASRFMAGLVTRLDPPERAMREQIIRVFSRRRGLSIDDAAVAAIAERATGSKGAPPSVRDLEGMLTKVEAVSHLLGKPYGSIGLVAVESAFGLEATGARGHGRPLRADQIVEDVCLCMEVEPSQLMGTGRHRRVVLARSLVAYLSRELTTQSYPEIARAMGRPSHSTVITAHQRFTRQLTAREACGLNGQFSGLTVVELCDRVRRAIVDRSRRS